MKIAVKRNKFAELLGLEDEIAQLTELAKELRQEIVMDMREREEDKHAYRGHEFIVCEPRGKWLYTKALQTTEAEMAAMIAAKKKWEQENKKAKKIVDSDALPYLMVKQIKAKGDN